MHMHRVTHWYTRAVGSQLQRPGSMGVRCLAQGHLSRDKEVNCHPSSCQPTNPFLSGEWGLNRQPSGYWTITLTTELRPKMNSQIIWINDKSKLPVGHPHEAWVFFHLIQLGPHVQRLAWISYWNMAYAETKMPSNLQKYPDVSMCAHAWIQAHFVCTSQPTWNWAHMSKYSTPPCPRPYSFFFLYFLIVHRGESQVQGSFKYDLQKVWVQTLPDSV